MQKTEEVWLGHMSAAEWSQKCTLDKDLSALHLGGKSSQEAP